MVRKDGGVATFRARSRVLLPAPPGNQGKDPRRFSR
jgi:hypothetical protein